MKGHVGVGVFLSFPLAFKDVDEPAPAGQQSRLSLVHQETSIFHGPAEKSSVRLCPLGVTHLTPMPKTTIKLIRCVGVWIVRVDGVSCTGDVMCTVVPGVLDPLAVQEVMIFSIIVIGSGHHMMLLAFVLGQV